MGPKKLHARQPGEPDLSATSLPMRDSDGRKPTAKSLLAAIRLQLETGEIRRAKRLASMAARRHPRNAEIVDLHRVLNDGRSFAQPGTGRDLRPEYEWLRDPPKVYRGQWVALVGDAVVGSAKTLRELQAALPPDLSQTPLAVQIPL